MAEVLSITPRCPIRTTLELVGGKWRLMLIYQLKDGPLRFGDLKRLVPDISEKMLGQELKFLTDSGLVNRHNYGEVPPRVEYSLTPSGQTLLPVIEAMYAFGTGYLQNLALGN